MDCSQRGANQDLISKYGVSGFPTVIFTDPAGNEVERLQGRDANSVKAQIQRVAAAHNRRTFQEISVADGLKQARAENKPLGVLFTGTGKEEERTNAVLELLMADAISGLREGFVWIARPLKGADGKSTDDAKELRARKGGTLVLLRSTGQAERLRDRVLESITRPNKLEKDLRKALDEAAASAAEVGEDEAGEDGKDADDGKDEDGKDEDDKDDESE